MHKKWSVVSRECELTTGWHQAAAAARSIKKSKNLKIKKLKNQAAARSIRLQSKIIKSNIKVTASQLLILVQGIKFGDKIKATKKVN